MPSHANNSLNPFAPLDPQTAVIRAMLVSRIAESEPSPFWQGRAGDLAASIAPLLAWVEKANGLNLNSSDVKALLQFDTLVALGNREPVVLGFRAPDLTDLPATATEGIRAYLAGLPGYDPPRPSPENSQARQIHGYALYALRQHLA